MKWVLTIAIAGSAAACASAPATSEEAPASPATPGAGVSRIDSPWPVKTRLHIDLWLHGFAMIQADTTKVPFFRPGYVTAQRAAKSAAGVNTLLDVNRERLAARLSVNRDLIGAQFLALYFGTWDQMVQAMDLFLRAEGDPRRGGNEAEQQSIYALSQSFQTPADREWLRIFAQSLQDENNRWYRTWWGQEQRNRARVVERVDSLWNGVYRAKIQGYLNNTQQAAGDLFLSIPLNGEGRSSSGARAVITVGFPEQPSEAIEAILVFAHEAASAVAIQAINDNTTPAEKRAGSFDFLQSAGLVRGGEMLLAKLAPELVPAYARYYLGVARRAEGGDARAALAREFPLPEPIRAAIQRQIEIVVGGI